MAAGNVVQGRPPDPPHEVAHGDPDPPRGPRGPARKILPPVAPRGGFAWFWEDFQAGDVIVHSGGRTVSEAEAMALATLDAQHPPASTSTSATAARHLSRRRASSTGASCSPRVLALASRDTAGNAVWDLGLDDGAHPERRPRRRHPLRAATLVVGKEPARPPRRERDPAHRGPQEHPRGAEGPRARGRPVHARARQDHRQGPREGARDLPHPPGAACHRKPRDEDQAVSPTSPSPSPTSTPR